MMKKKPKVKKKEIATIESENKALWRQVVDKLQQDIKNIENELIVQTAFLETAKRRLEYYEDEELTIYE